MPFHSSGDISMAKLYIFDLGDVIMMGCRSLRRMASELSIDEEEFIRDYNQWNAALMEGFVSTDSYYRHLENRYGCRIESELFTDGYDPVISEDVLSLVDSLRISGNRAVIGSNTFACYDEWNKERYPELYGHFDNRYLSNEIHRRKPEAAFFLYILEKEGFRAEDAVFIDDREENTISAEKLGIRSILFRSAEDLKEKIEEAL